MRESNEKVALRQTRYRKRIVEMRVNLPRDDHEELKRVAAKRKCSMMELIRLYVTWGLEQDES